LVNEIGMIRLVRNEYNKRSKSVGLLFSQLSKFSQPPLQKKRVGQFVEFASALVEEKL
jgi:hypothetical protein